VNEAAYFVAKSRQRLILVSSEAILLGKAIQKHVAKEVGVGLLEILPNIPKQPTYSPLEISISSNRPIDESAPGLVIFTSGTTGRPKGAVMRRSYVHETALAIGEGYDVDHNDVLLHVLPVHHTTGLGTSFFPYLNAGACIEFKRGSFDPAWVWDRWLQGGLTVFSAVPTHFLRLKWHYEQKIVSSPNEAAYAKAANQFRSFMCGSSALQQHVQDFWTLLRQNRPILTRYGATEFPGCLKVPAGMQQSLPPGCVGLPVPGVELKLSEGDTGELLVKSPYMFAK
jgi:malonyl-CoA/methylmalonyl-CoA synthetase